MDAVGLPALFSQSNPYLAQMGEQEWQQGQAKAQQALQTAQGQEQRAQAMQPLEEAHKRATTGYNQALSAQMNENMAAQPPAADRMKLAMSEYRKKMSDSQAAEEDTKMQRRLHYAEMAAKNNGVLPLEYLSTLPEDERGHFANPKAVATTQRLAKAWYDSHPKTIENRAKQAADLERARIMAEPGMIRANKAGAGGGEASLKTNFEQEINRLNRLAAAEQDEGKKAALQAEADRVELMMHRKIREQALVRKEGDFDLGAKGVPTVPTREPTPTPRAGSTTPAKAKEIDVEALSPEQKKAAAAIREQFRAKKISQEQAIQQIEALSK